MRLETSMGCARQSAIRIGAAIGAQELKYEKSAKNFAQTIVQVNSYPSHFVLGSIRPGEGNLVERCVAIIRQGLIDPTLRNRGELGSERATVTIGETHIDV